jgi:hypothetical protein
MTKPQPLLTFHRASRAAYQSGTRPAAVERARVRLAYLARKADPQLGLSAAVVRADALLVAFRYQFRDLMNRATAARFSKWEAVDMAARTRAVVAFNRAKLDVAAGRARYHDSNVWAAGTHDSERPGLFHVMDVAATGLRFVGTVKTEGERRNGPWSRENGKGVPSSGWTTDPHGDIFQDGTGLVWGVVYQLPARDGCARFLAGYQFGGTDAGPTLDLSRVFSSRSARGDYGTARDHDDACDAAIFADEMAKRAAEQEREHQAAWGAGQQWAELAADVKTARREALALAREMREIRTAAPAKWPAAACAMRARFADLWESLNTDRRKMRELADGDHETLGFWTGDKALREAFAEGAGLDAFPS